MRSVVQVHLGPPPNKITKQHGGVAQLGEHLPCKQGVRSSILLVSTKKCTLKTTQKKKTHVKLSYENKKRPNEPNTLGQTRKCRMKKHAKLTESQVRKGIRRMPRRQEPKKDAISCEKLWGAASRLRSIDIRMRELSGSNVPLSQKEGNPEN